MKHQPVFGEDGTVREKERLHTRPSLQTVQIEFNAELYQKEDWL